VARRLSMDAFTTVLEVVGAVVIAVGFFVFWVPAGLVVAGVELVGLGYLLAPAPRGGRR